MKIKRFDQEISICRVIDYSQVNLDHDLIFTAKSGSWKSLICPTSEVPENTLSREDGYRIFSLEGLTDDEQGEGLTEFSTLMSTNHIQVSIIRTFAASYILAKEATYDKAIDLLIDLGHDFAKEKVAKKKERIEDILRRKNITTSLSMAGEEELETVLSIYEHIHDAEEAGTLKVGWNRQLYPTRETLSSAIVANQLFIMEANDQIIGAAIFNEEQLEEYSDAPWQQKLKNDQVLVLHALAIDPAWEANGLGQVFEHFMEAYAKDHSYKVLRLDVYEENEIASRFFTALDFTEIATIRCNFHGMEDRNHVLFEKALVRNPWVGTLGKFNPFGL